MKLLHKLLVILVLTTTCAFAQDSNTNYEKRSYTTKPIQDKESPIIDGVLDEGAWSLVEWTTDYLEFQPDVGTPPTEQTKMKIIYDDFGEPVREIWVDS